MVELIIGMTLAGMIMAAVLSSYLFLGRQFTRLINQQSLETQGRRTVQYFTQDVRTASAISNIVITTNTKAEFTLTLATSTGTKSITYYFNDTNAAVTAYSVNIPAYALSRIDRGSSTGQTLLTNVTETGGGVSFSFYDSAGHPYTSYTSYLASLKQISMTFSTQFIPRKPGTRTKVLGTGTITPIYQGASARLLIRNKSLLN